MRAAGPIPGAFEAVSRPAISSVIGPTVTQPGWYVPSRRPQR